MRFVYRALVVMLIALLALTGCKAGGKKADVVKIQVMVGFGGGTDSSQQPIHEAVQKEFNETIGKEKGIEMEFVVVQYSEAEQKFTTLVAGGMTPDICGPVGISGVAKFMDEWLDIAPYIARDKYDVARFDKALLDTHLYHYDGKDMQVGLPIGFYPSVLFYNEDIFDRAGLPYPPTEWGTPDWTYDKLYEIARKLTIDEKGRNADDPNFDLDIVAQYGYDGGDWAPWRAFIGKFFDDNGKSVALGMSEDYKTVTMNSKEWIAAFTELEKQIYKYKIRPRVDPATGASLFGDDDPMGSNKLGMWEVFSWIRYAWEGWDANFHWNVAAIPSLNGHIVSPTNSDTFVMTKSAKHQEEAWEVYKFLFSDAIYAKLASNYGCIPAVKSLQAAWVDEQINGVWNDEWDDWNWNSYPRPDINWQVFLDAGAYADTPNNEAWVPAYGKVWDAMEDAMSNVISGLYTSPAQVAEDLNKEVQGYVDEYWAAR